jgi:hypothetical protein
LNRKQTLKQKGSFKSEKTRRSNESYSRRDFGLDRIDSCNNQSGDLENDDGYIYEDEYEYRDDEVNETDLSCQKKCQKSKKNKSEKGESETFITSEKVSASDSGKSSGFVSSSNSNSTITPVPSSYEFTATENISASIKSGKKSTKIQKIVHAKGNQMV